MLENPESRVRGEFTAEVGKEPEASLVAGLVADPRVRAFTSPGGCFGLKHQAVLDICIVSSAYLIRAIAGGPATAIPLSQWFLLVMAFVSLFMVAGKRYAELQLAERNRRQDPQIARKLHRHLSPICVDPFSDRGRRVLRAVGIRARWALRVM